MKKTVMEWLSEIKLYDKKINSVKEELNKNKLYYTQSNIYRDEKKETEELNKVTSLIQKYKALVNNKNIVKEAVMKFNANTCIEVEGKTYAIARALELSKGYDDFLVKLYSKNIEKLKSEKQSLEQLRDKEVKILEDKLYTANKQMSSDAINSQLDSRRKEYEVYEKQFVSLDEEFTKEYQSQLEFMGKINTVINIANAQHELEIELTTEN